MATARLRHAAVLVFYAAVSFGYFGWELLPHPGRTLLGTTQDPTIFMWSFAWWPHALLSLESPFHTYALYAPQGINLAWTTSVPGLAIPFAPLTLLFGPALSYNVAAVLLPALAAWTTYLLCLHLTRSLWASLVGGYLFGFSTYMVGQQMEGHLHLTGVFPVPLIALLVLRRIEGTIAPRRFMLGIGALVAFQLYVSTEVVLLATAMLVLIVGVTLLLDRGRRAVLMTVVRETLGGYLIAAVLAAPLAAFVIAGRPSGSFTASRFSGTDVLNLLLPTTANALAGNLFASERAHFNPSEAALYVGAPTLVLLGVWLWRGRRVPAIRAVAIALVVAIVLAFGNHLRVNGNKLFELPGALGPHLPLVENLHLPRFGMFLALAGAVAVAAWTARSRGRVFSRPYVVPVLAIAFIVPSVSKADFSTPHKRVAFFSDGGYRSCISGETVAVFPFGFLGDSMVWQSEAGFRFDLAEGYMYPLVGADAPTITRFADDTTVKALTYPDEAWFPTPQRLLAFAAEHGVDRFIVTEPALNPTATEMRAFGRVERRDGVLIAPACGEPSLRTRDLSSDVAAVQHMDAVGAYIGWCGQSFRLIPSGYRPDGPMRGAVPANYIDGSGLSCTVPPGYVRKGLAPSTYGVTADTYPLYVRDG